MVNIKSETDKFYTKPEIAQQCVDSLAEFTDVNLWLEPSAGAGVFLRRLPEPRLGLDIEPGSEGIIEQDFFTYSTNSKKVAVVGNPPFGKNCSLAIKFFNHAAKFATVIAFIVPRTFRKVSIKNKLDLGWVLHKEIELPLNSFQLYDDAGRVKDYAVPCVWQIWIPGKRSKVILEVNHPDWEWCSKKDADYAIRRVGGLAGKCFTDFENYAETSNYFIKTSPEIFDRLCSLEKEFKDIAKNTAGNPSLSKGELIQIYKEKYHKK